MKRLLTLMMMLSVPAMSFTSIASACGGPIVMVINKSDKCVKLFSNAELIGTVEAASWSEIEAYEDLKEIKAVACSENEISNKVAFMKTEFSFPNEQIVYPNDFE